ncbi:hypothetical protein C6P44_003659 [Monosporozyma unispora]|nr:hypothetical protein C6P44_003659 [Kazachstania unispora]
MTGVSENGFMITKYHLPNCKSSSGTTALIRNKLRFDDGIKWNNLCKMRTELIKTHFHGMDMVHINLNLIENKDRVEEVADCLRVEFNYPKDTHPEFQKLVIMAIQSIRRNLIRAQNNKLNKRKQHEHDLSQDPQPSQKLQKLDTITINNIHNNNTSLISLVIKDVIDDVIPLKDQSKKEQSLATGFPDLNIFISDDPLLPKVSPEPSTIQKSKQAISIPFFLKEKILNNIQKSRTCYQLSRFNQSNIVFEYQNLIKLGETAITLTNRYIFERFYSNSNLNVIDFVLKQIMKPTFLIQLSSQLFQSSTTIKLSINDPNQTKMLITLLYITLGSLIKDFGFDPILYDISEILYHLIMMKYPNLSKNDITSNNHNNTRSSRESSVTNTPTPIKSDSDIALDKNILISSLSINPQIANKEVYKQVQISYQSKMQDFNFPLLSNATPTIKEIINNCKQLFQIKIDLDLNIYYNNEIVKTDIKLANLFNDLNIKVLHLELR